MTEVRDDGPSGSAAPDAVHIRRTMIGCVELLGRMTLEEKLAQIVGFWEKEDGEAVAPLQGEFGGITDLDEFSRHGLGHLTRVVRHPPRRPWRTGGLAVGVPAWPGDRDQARYPGDRARGVPYRAIGVEGGHVSDAAGLGRVVRSRACCRDGRGNRRVDARPRHPSGARARPRCGARPPLGSRRRVHRRGPLPGRHDRYLVRARPAVARACTPRSSTLSATRPRAPGATSPRCTPGHASSPTCCCSRSRWRFSTAAPVP